ncbi:MAG: rhomboid-like protein [Mycobacterium sp.]
MASAVLSRLGRVRVTLAYAAALVAVAALMVHLSPHVQERVIRQASTNLHNLSQGRIGTLAGSAFVNETQYIYVWLPGLVALLALGELLWHSRRLMVAFVVGHVGATLLVAAGIAGALTAGLVSASIADAADVGMSYGAVAVLGTFTAAISGRWRAAWAGGWLAVAFGSAALSGWDFTNVGHAIALVLGMAISTRFGTPAQWTLPRYGLLAVAAGFGYLMIAYGEVSPRGSMAMGLLGAVVALAISALPRMRRPQTNSSALASIQSDSHASGGHSSSSPGISHS